jgi:hypothetical protein
MLKKIWFLSIVAVVLIGKAAPAGSAVIRVAGTAFRPISSNIDFQGISPAIWADTTIGLFETPLYLPQGAVVTGLRMYWWDGSNTYDCTGSLMRYDIVNGTSISVGTTNSSGMPGTGYSDSAAFSHTIDYNQYAYSLTWNPKIAGATQMMLFGFQITYTPPPGRAAVIPLY